MFATATLALLGAVGDLAPQGPLDREHASPVSLAQDPEQMVFHPFRDGSGNPERADVQAAGLADLDGNGMPDAWFVGGAGPHFGELSVQMARAASVGRFRDWHVQPAGPRPWSDAATLHCDPEAQERVLLVDPSGSGMEMLHFVPSTTGDPRTGPGAAFWVTPFLPMSVQDHGIFEIETRNDDGDPCDDVVLLVDRGNGVTEVRKLVLGYRYGPVVLRTVSLQVALPLQRLRLLDLDADGATDFVVEVPGWGAVACRDAGGSFQLAAALPTGGTGIVDLFTGTIDPSTPGGTDAFGVLFADRAWLYWLDAQGFGGAILDVPSTAWPLAAGAVVEGENAVGVVTLLSEGARRLHALSYSPPSRGFVAMIPEAVPDPSLWSGPGAGGLTAICADVDDDGDRDLVTAHPDGAGWLTLRNDGASLAPDVRVVHRGPLIPETGWFWEQFVVTMPAAFTTMPELEVAVILEHPTTQVAAVWDRRVYPVDPQTRQVTVDVFMQTIPNNVRAMHAFPAGYMWPFGFTAGGKAQISFHAKGPAHAAVAGSPQRYESHLRFHDPGGEGNKSAQGVRWERRVAPPLPRGDDDILPWD